MEDDHTLPWGLDSHDLKAPSLSAISSMKLKAFDEGRMNTVVKKNPHQKQREEEESKKKET